MAFVGNDVSPREAFNIFLREGLPSTLDALGLGDIIGINGRVGGTSRTRRTTEQPAGAGTSGSGSDKPSSDPTKTLLTAAAGILAIAFVVFLLLRVFK